MKRHWSWYGKTGIRRDDGRCSNCGASNFSYNNGHEISEDGVRGYRCVTCGTIKPEREDSECPDGLTRQLE